MFHAMSEHHLVEDFTTSLSNETANRLSGYVITLSLEGCIRLIHVVFPGVDQRLDIVLVLLDIKPWARDIACRSTIVCISICCLQLLFVKRARGNFAPMSGTRRGATHNRHQKCQLTQQQ